MQQTVSISVVTNYASYLNGDYSPANQERVADQYVAGRYGSWDAAKSFWLANGWY